MKPVVPANVSASPKTLVTSCAKAALDSAAASNNELMRVQCMIQPMLDYRANAVHREYACKDAAQATSSRARAGCGDAGPGPPPHPEARPSPSQVSPTGKRLRL